MKVICECEEEDELILILTNHLFDIRDFMTGPFRLGQYYYPIENHYYENIVLDRINLSDIVNSFRFDYWGQWTNGDNHILREYISKILTLKP